MKKISYSLLREILNKDGFCGHYIDMVFNKGIKDDPTDAMVDGLYFEQEAIGSTRDGVRVEIPKLLREGKDGTYISQREKDLNVCIDYAKTIFKENKISIFKIQIAKEKDDRKGHIDFLGEIAGRYAIFDLKYTGMSWKTWEKEFLYGQTNIHFKLQARHYQSLFDEILPFYFIVIGYNWSRIFLIEYEPAEIEHHKEVASYALKSFNEMDFRPTNDSRLCFNCRLRHKCEKINNVLIVETL